MKPTNSPFFIVGCPRSGTTLLQILLDAHPQICIPLESHVFGRFADFFHAYGDLRKQNNLESFATDLLKDERIKTWRIDISVDELCHRVSEPSVRGLINALFTLHAQREGKTAWGDKTPQHMFKLDAVKTVFPEAKIIHLVRDGRDVAESLSRVSVGPKSIYGIAKYWNKYIATFEKFKQNYSSQDILEIRYEDLVSEPEVEVKEILDFLDMATDFKGLESNGVTQRQQQYLQKAAHHRLVGDPVSRAKVGIYKEAFSSRQLEIFEAIAGENLKRYGYALCTSEAADCRPWERVQFFWQDGILRYVRKFLGKDALAVLVFQMRVSYQLKLRKLTHRKRRKALG